MTETSGALDTKGSLGKVLVIESNGHSRKRLVNQLEDGGFEVVTAQDTSQVDIADIDVVILGEPDVDQIQEALDALERSPTLCGIPIVLILSKSSSLFELGSAIVAVDATLTRPVAPTSLVAVTKGFARASRTGRRLAERERQLEQAMQEMGRVDPHTGFYSFETFKTILAGEVKRARRYKYPFSIGIIAFDDMGLIEQRWGDAIARTLEGGLRLAISRSLRDLDIPVAYSSGQVLIVMPHTPRRGARVMAERVRGDVARTRMQGPAGKIGITISLGLASYEGQGEVSFGSLAREAAAALKIAVERGGNRVAEVPITRRRANAAKLS